MRTLVISRTSDPHRQAEALRAALGVTLRGAEVEVIVDEPLHTPLAQRAAETLRSFGHVVGPTGDLAGALARADVVEVWTDPPTTPPEVAPPAPPPQARRALHLVRATPPAGAVAAGDWVVYLEAMRLAPTGAPPLPAGPIDHDQLVQLSLAADRVITW